MAQATLTPIGSYHTGTFGESATEIIAWNAADELVYSTNGSANAIDVIDLSDPTKAMRAITLVSVKKKGSVI